MGQEKAPAFQFYPQDYLASSRVAEMTLEEEGAYIRLLCYAWTTGGIPRDPERCARLAGKGCSTTVATNVQRAFNEDPTDSTRLVHNRLELEREKQRLRKQQTSEAGHRSAEARRAKSTAEQTKNKRSTNVQRNVNPSSSSSMKMGSDSVAESQAIQFAEFWKAYPKKKDKGAAERAFKKAIQNATFAQIMGAVAKYALEQIEPQYRKHPATWLNARAWEDEQPDLPKKSNPMGFMNELLGKKSRGEITEDEFQNIVFQEMNRRD